MKNPRKKPAASPPEAAAAARPPALTGRLAQIEQLLTLLERHGVAEFEQEGERRLRIRFKGDGAHGHAAVGAPMVAAHAPAPAAAALAAPPAAPSTAPASKPAAPAEGTVLFKSPMVGTYYRSPSPEAEPFVRKKDKVGPETTLCIIEAMKVMNDIKAEMDAEVVDVLVENGQAVEFGQPLFVLKPA